MTPPLTWENVPKGTKSFALTETDPDVPPEFHFPRVFARWMIYNIPASITGLGEGASPGGSLPKGCKELMTLKRSIG
jgi:ribose transport system ATP-binding protein